MLSTLLAVLFFILKLVGILLLLILLVLALVLLVPIQYGFEVSDREGESFLAGGKVTWFIFLLRCRVEYTGSKLIYAVRILGFTLLSNEPEYLKKKEEKAKKKESSQHKEKDKKSEDTKIEDKVAEEIISDDRDIDDDQETSDTDEEEILSADIEEKDTSEEIVLEADTEIRLPEVTVSDEKPENQNSEEDTVNLDSEEDTANLNSEEVSANQNSEEADIESVLEEDFEEKKEKISLLTRIEQLKKKLEELRNMVDEYQLIYLIGLGKNTLMRVLRHVLPGKISGWVEYGFDDPSATGKVTALLAMFYTTYGKSFSVQPDFGRSCFAGEFKGRGRIRLGFFVVILISLLMKKEVRKLIGLLLR